MTEPRGPIGWANQQANERAQKPAQYTADTITSDALDQLYAERERYRLAWTSARTRAGGARIAWRCWFRLAEKRRNRVEQAERVAQSAARDTAKTLADYLAAEQRAEQAEAANARVRALHRPAEYMGRIICAECSAYCGESTDNPPALMPCPTVAALDEPKEPRT